MPADKIQTSKIRVRLAANGFQRVMEIYIFFKPLLCKAIHQVQLGLFKDVLVKCIVTVQIQCTTDYCKALKFIALLIGHLSKDVIPRNSDTTVIPV